MKIICLITLSFVSSVCLAETDDEHRRRFAAETAHAFELERSADFVANYSTGGKLDIGIGRTDKAKKIQSSISFSLEELETFFDVQRHKDLIVVVVAKNTWSDKELQNHVAKLRDYFVARGYKKVAIQQGLGAGRGIHLEYEAEGKPGEATAERTALKPEGNKKPQP